MTRRALLLLSALAAGCAKEPASVTGTVTYQGKPVRSGTVTFIGSDRLPYPAALAPDGRYAVEKLPPGPAKVLVSSPNPTPRPTGLPPGPKPKAITVGGGGARADQAAGWFPLPDRYADPLQSDLSRELRSGPNVVDLTLP